MRRLADMRQLVLRPRNGLWQMAEEPVRPCDECGASDGAARVLLAYGKGVLICAACLGSKMAHERRTTRPVRRPKGPVAAQPRRRCAQPSGRPA